MSEASFIPLKTLDAALDQVTTTPVLDGLTAAGIVGYKHGVRMLRQRIGGQFLRNQAHHLTPQQLTECVQVLQAEVAQQTAPILDAEAKTLGRSREYWRGYDQGVSRYQGAIEALRAPSPPTPASPARRRIP